MVAPAGSPPRSVGRAGSGLAEALRDATRELHRRAERAGVMAELLAGRLRPTDYLLLAFNLLPVYRALEAALAEHARHAVLAPIVWPELTRAEALACDVAVLVERSSGEPPRLLAEGERYRRRIETVARQRPERLLAHAYVRHLGDLSGGQILQRLLARIPGIGPEALRFYAFPELGDLARARAAYRRAIDRAGLRLLDREGVLEEAREAFRLNIALFEAVARAGVAAQPEPSPSVPA